MYKELIGALLALAVSTSGAVGTLTTTSALTQVTMTTFMGGPAYESLSMSSSSSSSLRNGAG